MISDPCERWCIVFVAEPGEVPAGRRVARVLKNAKRSHGLRCIEVSSFTLAEQLERLRSEVAELKRQLASKRKVVA